jgi:ABC-type transporter Mla subunit MlaD
MQNPDSQTIQLAIVAAVAVTMLLQAVALLAILVVVRKSVRSMHDEVQELRTSITGVINKVEPVLDSVRQIVTRTGPKIESSIADLATMSANLRKQSNDVQTAAAEIAERFRRQSARVDAKLTSIFDVLDRATNVMSDTVAKPMRQLAGILASAKAVMETLRNGAPESRVHEDHKDDEKDIYI